MNFYHYYGYPVINHCINGEDTVNYDGMCKYTGRRENGMKIGKGILETELFKLEVKIKKGQIHKCIKVLRYPHKTNQPLRLVNLPPLKITKVGMNYQEEYSNSDIFCFTFARDKQLFDGKAYPLTHFKSYLLDDYKVYVAKLNDSKSCKRSIVEFRSDFTSFYGYCMNFTPNGSCKILNRNIIFKGDIKGSYFKGPCIVKYPEYKITFDTYLGKINFPVKVFIKCLKTELLLTQSKSNSLLDIKSEKKSQISLNQLREIEHSIKESCTFLKNFATQKFLSMTVKFLSYLFVIDTNWQEFEQKIENLSNDFEFFVDKNSVLAGNNEKCFKRFKGNERYEGKIVNGKFEGFGKYFYADGSVYVGEFKNNLRNGLGNFKFKDGRMYRGHWVDDLMHGKGSMVNGKIKVKGIWKKNQMKSGDVCYVYALKDRLE